MLLSDSLAFAERLDDAGAEYEFALHEGVHHGFMMFSPRLERANAAIDKAAAFARKFG